MADTLSTLAAVGVGAVVPIVAIFIQGWQNNRLHKQQLKEAQEARDREAKEAKKENIRQQYSAILESVLAIVNLISETQILANSFSANLDPFAMVRVNVEPGGWMLAPGNAEIADLAAIESKKHSHLFALVREVMSNLDKTRAALIIDGEPDVVPDALRQAIQIYAAGIEAFIANADSPALKAQATIIFAEADKLKQTLPERMAKV